MPEVAVGAFLEYKIKISQNKKVAGDQFTTSYSLQSDSPIEHAELHLKMPKGKKLNQTILNSAFVQNKESLNPVVSESDGKMLYSWIFKHLEQIIPEPQMPPVSEVAPIILLSTFESWQTLYNWWWPLAKDKIQVSDTMREKISELTQGTKTLREKAQAIYNFCARDIGYVGVEYGQAGYEPHPAAEIFSNKYGDCKDQSILLIAMLKEVGIKAYPVLIGTKNVPKLQRDFPTMLFNHCIVLAQIEGEDIFLDPTGETVLFGDLPQGDQDRSVFVCFEGQVRLMQTPKYSAAHNQVIKKTVLTLASSKEVKGHREIRAKGIFDQGQRAWLRYTMPALVEETLRQKIQDIVPEGKLLGYQAQNLEGMKENIVLSYDFSGSDFLIRAGKKTWVVPQLGGLNMNAVSQSERIFGIDFVVPQAYTTILEINLPKEYTVKSLPEAVQNDNEWFSYKHGYAQENHTIIFTEEYIYKKDFIDVQSYAAYKQILETLSKDIRQSIVLEEVHAQK
jgi:hypothetical protein